VGERFGDLARDERKRFGMRALPLLVATAMLVSLAACGDDDGDSSGNTTSSSSDAPESRSEVVHTFEGHDFTCEDALDINPEVGCSDEIVDVWEEWGQNLPDYVDSGQLGPLNDDSWAVGDVAFAGVMACVISDGGGDEQDFIDYMQDPDNQTQLDELAGTELLPAWFAAGQVLCPTGFSSSGDQVTP
jgi:hypothetical protein